MENVNVLGEKTKGLKKEWNASKYTRIELKGQEKPVSGNRLKKVMRWNPKYLFCYCHENHAEY